MHNKIKVEECVEEDGKHSISGINFVPWKNWKQKNETQRRPNFPLHLNLVQGGVYTGLFFSSTKRHCYFKSGDSKEVSWLIQEQSITH